MKRMVQLRMELSYSITTYRIKEECYREHAEISKIKMTILNKHE
jgi:hypothetical protein